MNNIVRIILILIIVALLGVTGYTFFRTSQMKKFDKQIATVKQNFITIEQMIVDRNIEEAKTQFDAVKTHFQTIKENDVRIPLLPEYAKLNALLGDKEIAQTAVKECLELSKAWEESKKQPFEAALQYLALAEASIYVIDRDTYQECNKRTIENMKKVEQVPQQVRLNLGMARLCVQSNLNDFETYYVESGKLIETLPEGDMKTTFTSQRNELKSQFDNILAMLKKQAEAAKAEKAKEAASAEEAAPAVEVAPAEEAAPAAEVAPVEEAVPAVEAEPNAESAPAELILE